MGLWSTLARRRTLVLDALRTRLWPVPTVGVVVALTAGMALPQLDQAVDGRLPSEVTDLLFGGGPSAAREVLSAVAASLITVTSLTFSLTVVTLQLASSQFSPRLLRTFARDRFVQRTLALFLATFVYALTVLRFVRDNDVSAGAFVPEISITVAYVMALISLLGLVFFLAHLVREIRVEVMVHTVHADAVATASGLFDELNEEDSSAPIPVPPPGATVIDATSSGFLVAVDEDALLDAAVRSEAIIAVDRMPGDWLVEGTPVAFAWHRDPHRGLGNEELDKLRSGAAEAIKTGNERTPVQDVGYGLRQLTDVAIKALSPGINDPTTAIHVLGHSSSLLCELADRNLGPSVCCDDDDAVRVVIRRPRLADLLDLAVSQPRHYGASDAAVLTRLFELLRELAWRARGPDDKAAVAEQLGRLQRTVAHQGFDTAELAGLDRRARDVDAALSGEWPAALSPAETDLP